MVWQGRRAGADWLGFQKSLYQLRLFLRLRSSKPQVVSTCFSFPLWLLLTVQWLNKGNQICFYLDVSQCSVRFRVHLRRSLFQEASFQYHRATVCLSMCTSTTPVGIMSWVQAHGEKGHQQSLATLPGIFPKQRLRNRQHEKMCSLQLWQLKTNSEYREPQCLPASVIYWVIGQNSTEVTDVSCHCICMLNLLTGGFGSLVTSAASSPPPDLEN